MDFLTSPITEEQEKLQSNIFLQAYTHQVEANAQRERESAAAVAAEKSQEAQAERAKAAQAHADALDLQKNKETLDRWTHNEGIKNTDARNKDTASALDKELDQRSAEVNSYMRQYPDPGVNAWGQKVQQQISKDRFALRDRLSAIPAGQAWTLGGNQFLSAQMMDAPQAGWKTALDKARTNKLTSEAASYMGNLDLRKQQLGLAFQKFGFQMTQQQQKNLDKLAKANAASAQARYLQAAWDAATPEDKAGRTEYGLKLKESVLNANNSVNIANEQAKPYLDPNSAMNKFLMNHDVAIPSNGQNQEVEEPEQTTPSYQPTTAPQSSPTPVFTGSSTNAMPNFMQNPFLQQ